MGAAGCRCDGDSAVDKNSEQTRQQDSLTVEPQSALKGKDAAALAMSEGYQQEEPPASTVVAEPPVNTVIMQGVTLEEKTTENPSGQGLSMRFKSDAGEEEEEEAALNVTFTRTPFGMGFHSGQLPITVKEVVEDGEAWSHGIKGGMVISAIAGVSVAGMSYDAAFALMKKHAAELPGK